MRISERNMRRFYKIRGLSTRILDASVDNTVLSHSSQRVPYPDPPLYWLSIFFSSLVSASLFNDISLVITDLNLLGLSTLVP